jgi:hypothetical protein
MSVSYRQCSECGKRALSIATRCPGCGRELPDPAVPDQPSVDLGYLRSVPVVLGLLTLVVVLAGIRSGKRHPQPAGEESSFVAPASNALSVDPLAASPRLAAPAAAATPAAPAEDTGRLLVARTWTHVRSRRSPRAELSAVLMPGDTVLADSLSQGWYRVALEGEVMGYAYQAGLTGIR